MKVVFKGRSRIPATRLILLLVLSVVSTFYYLRSSSNQRQKPPIKASLMTVSPIVPDLHLVQTPSESITRSVPIERNQTFSEVMQQLGFDPGTTQEIYGSAKELYNLAQIQAGKSLLITTTQDNQFSQLAYSIDPLKTLVINQKDGALKAEIQERTVETGVQDLGGFIDGSLYSTMNQLGEEDELVIDFASIFEWDVDFFKDLQEGDSFRIVYERKYVDGRPFGYGNILAAELINKGKTYTAIGFQRGRTWEFFSLDGKAMKKAFLASPLKFSRITSGFSNHRYHPILHTYRPHYGIDYGAPYGTPVRSIGAGRVISAGWAGGAGRMIKIQHNNEIATVYCHLSRFGSGIRNGAAVRQGQVIGYVGSTGLSTGPHLDFRYLKNGRYINFLSIKSPQAETLNRDELAKFHGASTEIAQRLAGVKLLQTRTDIASLAPTAIHFSEGTN